MVSEYRLSGTLQKRLDKTAHLVLDFSGNLLDNFSDPGDVYFLHDLVGNCHFIGDLHRDFHRNFHFNCRMGRTGLRTPELVSSVCYFSAAEYRLSLKRGIRQRCKKKVETHLELPRGGEQLALPRLWFSSSSPRAPAPPATRP